MVIGLSRLKEVSGESLQDSTDGRLSSLPEVIDRINELLEHPSSIVCGNCGEYMIRYLQCPSCGAQDFSNRRTNIQVHNILSEPRTKPISQELSDKEKPINNNGKITVLHISEKKGKINSLQILLENEVYSINISNYELSNINLTLRLGKKKIKHNGKFKPYSFSDERFKSTRNFILEFLKQHHNIN